MTTEKKLRAFLDDIVAMCKKHDAEIINQDEYGMLVRMRSRAACTPAIIEIYDIDENGYENSGYTRYVERHNL